MSTSLNTPILLVKLIQRLSLNPMSTKAATAGILSQGLLSLIAQVYKIR